LGDDHNSPIEDALNKTNNIPHHLLDLQRMPVQYQALTKKRKKEVAYVSDS
jgi:hypothetical protein